MNILPVMFRLTTGQLCTNSRCLNRHIVSNRHTVVVVDMLILIGISSYYHLYIKNRNDEYIFSHIPGHRIYKLLNYNYSWSAQFLFVRRDELGTERQFFLDRKGINMQIRTCKYCVRSTAISHGPILVCHTH